jgi:hypothetical protein
VTTIDVVNDLNRSDCTPLAQQVARLAPQHIAAAENRGDRVMGGNLTRLDIHSFP